jgi:catechol-2,3-dioxygenase
VIARASGALDSAALGVLGINHVAFRTPDATGLRRFYLELTGAEELEGEHGALRLGQTLLAFFQSESGGAAADPDEIAFDVDASGFSEVLERAQHLGCEIRGPVEHTASSRGFYLSDPDGRRLEFTHEDRGVYWRE